jgi:hypothetical protein
LGSDDKRISVGVLIINRHWRRTLRHLCGGWFAAPLDPAEATANLLEADITPNYGQIAVVGCSANKTVRDWVWAVLCVPPARLGSWWHSETRDVGVVVTDPCEGLDEIRRVAADVLPGASVRRALYYRYLLRWATIRRQQAEPVDTVST